MTRYRTLAAVVALFSLMVTAPVRAGEPDPQQIAQQCIEHVAQVTGTCVSANAFQASQCVQMVNALQANGHPVLARLVADACTLHVLRRSHECGSEIRQSCHQCVHVLLALDAPGLANIVQNACEQGLAAVHQSRNQAIAAIRMSLDD